MSAEMGVVVSVRGNVVGIIVERIWRSIKYETIFLHEFTTMAELRARIACYVAFYNDKRPRQSHDYETPTAVYVKVV